jgi:hypothetical protein
MKYFNLEVSIGFKTKDSFLELLWFGSTKESKKGKYIFYWDQLGTLVWKLEGLRLV